MFDTKSFDKAVEQGRKLVQKYQQLAQTRPGAFVRLPCTSFARRESGRWSKSALDAAVGVMEMECRRQRRAAEWPTADE